VNSGFLSYPSRGLLDCDDI